MEDLPAGAGVGSSTTCLALVTTACCELPLEGLDESDCMLFSKPSNCVAGEVVPDEIICSTCVLALRLASVKLLTDVC